MKEERFQNIIMALFVSVWTITHTCRTSPKCATQCSFQNFSTGQFWIFSPSSLAMHSNLMCSVALLLVAYNADGSNSTRSRANTNNSSTHGKRLAIGT